MRINFLTKLSLVWAVWWAGLSYAVYFLGLAGMWHKPVLWALALVFILGLVIYLRRTKFLEDAIGFIKQIPHVFREEKLLFIPLLFFLAFVILNIIGAIAPEKEFDALWYHLTIPKIYLFENQIQYIPGNLLYYSVMPRLSEMLYALTLSFDSGGIIAKLLHFSFGLMWAVLSFEILRLYFSRTLSAWLALTIYGLSIVSHLSGTAYIDLIVCFYAAGAIWGFVAYLKTNQKSFLYYMAVFLGLGLSTKLYGVLLAVSLGLVVIIYNLRAGRGRELIAPAILVLSIPMVYFLNAYLATGNPIYPVFSIRDSAFELWIRGASTYHDWIINIWPTKVLSLFWWSSVYAFTPVLGLIFLLPLADWRKNRLIIPFVIAFVLFFLLWSLLPVWEPRYLMVILPLWAVLIGWVITAFRSTWFKTGAAVLIGIGLIYNFNLSLKNFAPQLQLAAGKVSRTDYINKYIGSVWYNFYDTEGFLAKNLRPGEKILTVHFHNLFYAPDGFVEWSTIEDKILSAEDLMMFVKEKNIRFITFNKIEKEPWPKFPREDLERYFKTVWEDSQKEYFEIK